MGTQGVAPHPTQNQIYNGACLGHREPIYTHLKTLWMPIDLFQETPPEPKLEPGRFGGSSAVAALSGIFGGSGAFASLSGTFGGSGAFALLPGFFFPFPTSDFLTLTIGVVAPTGWVGCNIHHHAAATSIKQAFPSIWNSAMILDSGPRAGIFCVSFLLWRSSPQGRTNGVIQTG
jgi:hypothetical protein